MTPKQFKAYLWLIELIDNHDGITQKEINAAWKKERDLSNGKDIDRKTIYRYRKELEELFGLKIECDRQTDYKYYLKNRWAMGGKGIVKWMLRTLSVGLQVADCMGLSDRIILEDVPSGDKWLLMIIEAMKNDKRIELTYQGYGKPEGWHETVSPYCVKLYQRRWYLLAKITKPKLYTLPLDRIKEMQISEESFVMDRKFSAVDYFNDMYGIFRDDKSRKQRVVLRAFGDEHFYLRDAAIHHSLKEIGRGEGWVDFELNLFTTKELAGYILSRGKRLKVISPKSYAKEIEMMKE